VNHTAFKGLGQYLLPWDNGKRIIVLAGNKAVGTKACVLALTKFWKEALKNFTATDDFAAFKRARIFAIRQRSSNCGRRLSEPSSQY
jgi:hypothetical protein